MTFFEDEKKRINKYYHKFYLGIFLFIYFINVQSNVSYEITAIKNGADTYEKVKKETGANTYGCFACRLEIKKLLEENK